MLGHKHVVLPMNTCFICMNEYEVKPVMFRKTLQSASISSSVFLNKDSYCETTTLVLPKNY